MKLPETLAQTMMHYCCDAFFEDINGDKEDFLDTCKYRLDYNFSVSWSGAGSSGNCWTDEITEFPAEPEPEMEEFDKFLDKYFPNLLYREKYEIYLLRDESEEHDSDYYGGSTVQYTKGIQMIKFLEHMEKFYPEDEIVELDELIDLYGSFSQSINSYEQIKSKLDLKKSLDENLSSSTKTIKRKI